MTGQQPQTPGTGIPVDEVAAAFTALADVNQELWAAKAPEDLLATNMVLEQMRSRISAVQAQVAAEIEASDAQKSDGWASPADYLTATSGARRGHGNRLLRTARELTDALDATHQALHAGDISPEHASVIVKAIRKLPVDQGLRDLAEKTLLTEAANLIASELETAAERLLELLDPEGHAKREERHLDKLERSAHLNRFLAIVEDGLGGVRLRGRGTVEDAAVIKKVLESLAAPEPNIDDDCGHKTRDPRSHGARTWDALVGACQRLTDAEVLPTDHGAKPRVTVTISLADLQAGVGAATLDNGDRLSAAAVRKLACDAQVIPAVLGTDSEVLDVGRVQRLVTAAIWKALVIRDRHCRFPGCRRAPIACDAHHIQSWLDGGATSLDNLVLLCRAHHTVIHNSGWQVRLNRSDRLPEFRPPPGRHRLDHQYDACFQHDREGTDGWIRHRTPRTPPS